ncbi:MULTISPECIES: hypothetical protein [unclassified Bradyrhizobium]|uniref:hypothetical protein n=1 Tax=unclassified Bradyrhizobium TaxID=2631580 RepID=UPI001FFB4BC2|nr:MULTISPECIES: hypothetical protein [unclassified Bradyrhizobium]MCK1536835.1 hypothetical protein [Bradyrhizobium sp. 176]MCK1560138.1 hypothetical protein [Bradyrhizobium sp. 171]
MSEAPGDLQLRIAKLALAPDDVLVVKIDRIVSAEAFHRIGKHVRSQLGDADRKILVIDSQIDLSVITREEILRRLDGS